MPVGDLWNGAKEENRFFTISSHSHQSSEVSVNFIKLPNLVCDQSETFFLILSRF